MQLAQCQVFSIYNWCDRCEVRNKEINSQCAELLVSPLYILPAEEQIDRERDRESVCV